MTPFFRIISALCFKIVCWGLGCYNISRVFLVGFPKTVKGSDSIWVVVDRLTKSAHFVSIKISYPL